MWTSNIQSVVFSIVKNEVSKVLLNEYTDLHFTTSDKVQTVPQFPSVYIHEIGSIEQGMDLEGADINAIMCNIQIEVTDNISQERVRKTMGEVLRVMKKMRFSVVLMPEYQNTTETFRQVARFRRVIGQGDILTVN